MVVAEEEGEKAGAQAENIEASLHAAVRTEHLYMRIAAVALLRRRHLPYPGQQGCRRLCSNIQTAEHPSNRNKQRTRTK